MTKQKSTIGSPGDHVQVLIKINDSFYKTIPLQLNDKMCYMLINISDGYFMHRWNDEFIPEDTELTEEVLKKYIGENEVVEVVYIKRGSFKIDFTYTPIEKIIQFEVGDELLDNNNNRHTVCKIQNTYHLIRNDDVSVVWRNFPIYAREGVYTNSGFKSAIKPIVKSV